MFRYTACFAVANPRTLRLPRKVRAKASEAAIARGAEDLSKTRRPKVENGRQFCPLVASLSRCDEPLTAEGWKMHYVGLRDGFKWVTRPAPGG
jgi:hypothetical protein